MLALGIISLAYTIGQASAAIQSLAHVKTTTYDYIVVGGGTAGNVIANRLTEISSNKVLVIEAGPSNLNVLDAIVPFFATVVSPDTPYDWNYTTTPQTGYDGRTIVYPRGHILGGSSSINYMTYTRGATDDYDSYAELIGDDGYSWANIFPYFLKTEKWTLPLDGHNITDQFNASAHSTTGINAVSLDGYKSPLSDMIINASMELGGAFAYQQDMNDGYPLGVGFAQSSIGGEKRSSSATSYLGPSYIQRSNLDVLVNTRVSRILPLNANASVPEFLTVELQTDGSTTLQTITASKEVILSAGVIGTPSILMHSGIGDSATLEAVGVTPVVQLPGVGQNLQDQPTVFNAWSVSGNNTMENYYRSSALQAELLEDWQLNVNGSGDFLLTGAASHLGWIRLDANNSFFDNHPDPTPGPGAPFYEIAFVNGILIAPPATGHYMEVSTVVTHPVSRGTVTINSSDPFAAPLIDPGYFTDANGTDLAVMREAIKGIRTFLTASSWTDYVIAPYGASTADDDDTLNAYIIAGGDSIHHPVGTAQMTPATDLTVGVVNPDFTVKKVAGLRVVDASVLPHLPSGHTQAAVYGFAEKAADVIKGKSCR